MAATFASHTVIPAPTGSPSQIFLANGSGNPGVFLQMNTGKGHYTAVFRNALGEECGKTTVLVNHITYLDIPVGGTTELIQKS